MRKNSKRVFAWLLTLSMVFTMLPTAAFAADVHTVTIGHDNNGYTVTCDSDSCSDHTNDDLSDSTYTANKENVVVDSSVGNNGLTIAGTAGDVTAAADCTISGTVSGTLTVMDSVTVEVNNNYTVTAVDGEAKIKPNSHHQVVSGKVELGNVKSSHAWYVGKDATATFNGVTVTNTASDQADVSWLEGGLKITGGTTNVTTAEGETPNVSIGKDTTSVAITGDVGTLTATGSAKVTVTGSVDTYNQDSVGGSPEITISGDLGSVTTSNNDGGADLAPTIKVLGELTGSIHSKGANSSTVHIEIGTPAVKFAVKDAASCDIEAWFDSAASTMTVKSTSKDQPNNDSVEHEGDGAVDYNIVMESGVFNSNGKGITGTVTFDNALASDMTDAGDVSQVPTVTDGKANDAKGDVDYIPSGQEKTFITDLVFEDGAAGYVNGQMGWTNKLSNIAVGANAYAAFSYANLDLMDGHKPFAIGENAVINLTGTRSAQIGTHYGLLSNSVTSALSDTFGKNVTFLMGAEAKLADDITIADHATATIKFYTANDSTDKGLAVGDGATLNVIGKDKDNLVEINGDKDTKVGADATLNLQWVNHNRGTGHEDILTVDTSTVVLNASKYSGDKNGNFETGNLPNRDEFGVPTTRTINFGETKLTVDKETVIVKPETVVDQSNGKKATVSYTTLTYTETADSTSGDKEVKLTEKVYTAEITDLKEGTTVVPVDPENHKYTYTKDGEDKTTEVAFSNITTNEVGYVLFGADGYGKAQVANGYQVSVDRVKDTPATFGGSGLKNPAASQEFGPYYQSDKVTVTIEKLAQGEKPSVEVKDLGEVSELDVVLENGNYKADFIVRPGDTMTITMNSANIAAESTFDVAQDATLVIVGNGNKCLAPIKLTHNDSTVVLDNVTLENGTNDHDPAAFAVIAGVTGAKLLVKDDSSIIGKDGTTETSESHYHSAAIRNQGALTVEVEQGKALTIQGGNAAIWTSHTDTQYYGGAGIHNANMGRLTFAGAGVTKITGGVGSTYTQTRQESYNGNGYNGGVGGAGIYNAGGIVVNTDSAVWAEGQVVVTGGTGGQGERAGIYSEKSYTTGGAGGASGTGILGNGILLTQTGVLLTYSGVGGAGGPVHGDNNHCDGHTVGSYPNTQTVYYDHSTAGAAGPDSAYAIDGAALMTKGGSSYAFSGDKASGNGDVGGVLTSLTVTGGTLWGSYKANTGYDLAALNNQSTNMVSEKTTTSGFAFKDASTNATNGKDTVYFTRIKTGTEGAKYLVEDISIDQENGQGAYAYRGANTGMYASEQGYLYIWLPDTTASGGSFVPATATLTLKEDGKDNRYQVTCGGNTATNSTNDSYQSLYGYGDVNGNAILKSVISYDGNAVWGEKFTLDGQTYYNGVDMAAAKAIEALKYADAPYTLDTAGKLAALAYVQNVVGKDFTGIDFTLNLTQAEQNTLSRLAWTPIGVDAAHAFKGVVIGGTYGSGGITSDMKTIQGIRMPAGYAGDAFGLFGYTDGASISYLTVDGSAITGNAYAKTLPTVSYTEGSLSTTSGGQYKWTADQMKWSGSVDAMGAIVGSAKDTAVSNCAVKGMTMESTKTIGDVSVGGFVGVMNGGKVAGNLADAKAEDYKIDGATVSAKTAAGGTAYAGGVAGKVIAGDVQAINVSGTAEADNVKVSATSADKPAYAGGVAGYAQDATIADFYWKNSTLGIGLLNYVTIKADSSTGSSYAGGISGASVRTAYDNNVVGSTVSITAGTGTTYAGGVTASSTNDTIRDTSVVKGTGDTTITATSGRAGGFAATSNGSKFYRSFVRGANVADTGSYVAMIQSATNTEMYGCYAQGTTQDSNNGYYAFASISGGKYVGCYTTAPGLKGGNLAMSSAGGVQYFNCYAPGTGTEVKAEDTLVGLDAEKLKGDALGAMNGELMKTESGANNSGFDWAAEFGQPIMYQKDSGAVNGGYPIHGEMVHLLVTVSEGADYLAEHWIDSVAPADQVFGADGSYWVTKGTAVTVTLAGETGVTIKSAKYTVNGTGETDATVTPSGSGGPNIVKNTAVTMDADTVLDFKVVPQNYYRYQVDLKDSGSKDSVTSSGTGKSVTVALSGSTVVKQTSTDKTNWSTDTGAGKVHAVILTGTNNATISVSTPAGWTQVSNSGNFKQYSIPAGATAAEVEAFVKGAKVVFAAGAKDEAVKGEVNLLVSEWSYTASLAGSYYNGHYYGVNTSSMTWAQADSYTRNSLSLLGAMNGSLAVIDDAAENAHVASLSKSVGWIAANDEAAEGTWVNSTPKGYLYGTGLNHTNWYTGEPNNAGGEDYAAINYGLSGRWNDYSATQRLSVSFKEYGGVKTENASGGSDAYAYNLTYTGDNGGGGGHGGGGGNGGGGTTKPTTPTKPVDPDVTGVSSLLNTKDHMAYLHGYGNGNFGADNNMTRGEVAQMFYNLLNNKHVSGSKSFSDVPESAWYHDAVAALANLGIVQGVGGGQFAPERSVTRAEFTVIAMRFADELTAGTKTFSDVPENHWAYDYIMAATGYGWINGYSNGTFKPSGTITRAEVTTIVNHMLGRGADKAYVDANRDDLRMFPDVKTSYWAYYDIVEATNAHDYTKTDSVESWKD